MKNLSLTAIYEKNRLSSDKPWLVAMKIHVRDPNSKGIVDVLRVVANSEVVTIEGEEYEPFPFDFDLKESFNKLPTLQVNIQDQTQTVQSYLQLYGGGVGSDVELIVVLAEDAQTTYSDPELIEYFQVVDASCSDYVVSWTLGAENPLTQAFPSRRQEQNQCSFRYKSEECGYTGSRGSCDLTLDGANGCRAHSNQSNYGGYPGIQRR